MAGATVVRPAPRTPGLGPASLVLYDVSTLYFELDQVRQALEAIRPQLRCALV